MHYTTEDKKHIVLVLLLYIVQGLPLGLFEGLKLIFAQRGVSMSQISELGYVYLPFTVKFLTAPILDSYYSQSFGQRKSYIVPIQYLLGLIFFYLAWDVDRMISDVEIFRFFIIGLSMVFLTAQQDISLDGWGLKLFDEDKQSICNTLNSVGQSIGIMISSNLLIYFTSDDHCKVQNQIQVDENCGAILGVPQYLYILGTFILAITLYTHFKVPEKQTVQLDDPITPLEVVKCLSQFWKNKTLRTVLVYLLIHKINFYIIPSSISISLVRAGYPKDKLASQASLITLVSLVFSFVTMKFKIKNKEVTYLKFSMIVAFLTGLIQFFIFSGFQNKQISQEQVYYALYPVSFIESIANLFCFVLMAGFCSRISDTILGASAYTVFVCIFNFGGQMINNFSLVLVDYFGYPAIIAFNIVFSTIFLTTIQNKMEKIQTLDKKNFQISEQIQHKTQAKNN